MHILGHRRHILPSARLLNQDNGSCFLGRHRTDPQFQIPELKTSVQEAVEAHDDQSAQFFWPFQELFEVSFKSHE